METSPPRWRSPRSLQSLLILVLLFNTCLQQDGMAQKRPKVPTTNTNDHPEDQPLSPAESMKTMSIAEDLDVELVLSDPLIAQPLQISFDSRGRLWLVEYRQYPMPAGLKVTSHDIYWRAVYDKVPPAPPHHDRGKDRISIHEDTDGDGVYDSHKVFVDGLNITSACAVAPNGVWVLNPPYLLYYPDENHDDVPDGDPEVHLAGFGLQDTHSVVNSLTWGPDGWLYAAQGSTVNGDVIRPGLDKKPRKSLGQNIWRYHPEKRIYEIFAEGGGNAFCVEIDRDGRIFSGHNGGNTRGFHYVQGGFYRKGFSKHGPLSNPYAYGYFDAMGHHDVPRFTHSVMIYEAETLPEQYRGKLFGVEPLQGSIVYSDVQPTGSTLKTNDLGRPVTSDDSWFRPVDIKLGPDGAIYFADWYDGRVAHLFTMEKQVDDSRGRVYRIVPKEGELDKLLNLQQLSIQELIGFFDHQNRTVRNLAMRAIIESNEPNRLAIIDQQLDELKQSTSQKLLPLFWTRYQIKPFSDEQLATFWRNAQPSIRNWSVRVACDDGQLTDSLAAELASLAASETDPDVQSQILCSARRLAPQQTLEITLAMLDHTAVVNDFHLPLLYWWNVESVISRDVTPLKDLLQQEPERMLQTELFQSLLAENLTRRLISSRDTAHWQLCMEYLKLAQGQPFTNEVVRGIELGLEQATLIELPEQLLQAMTAVGDLPLPIRLRLQNEEAIVETIKIISEADQSIDQKRSLLKVASELEHDKLAEAVRQATRQPHPVEIRLAAWQALQGSLGDQLELSSEDIPGDFASIDDRLVAGCCLTLASRTDWAKLLVSAVQADQIAQDRIPEDAVLKMTFHQDEQLRTQIAQMWGSLTGAATEQMAQTIVKLTELLDATTGDPYPGKALFRQHCAKCHELFEEGEYVGPGLTSYQRNNREHLLRNIVNPSAEIREGFELKVVITAEGRILTGFSTYEDDESLVLRGSEGDDVRISKDEIEEIIPQRKSLMPEGILEKLTPQQVVDLFAYLQIAQPLNN